jgi:2-polyprenyl-3-methyl-5-hydroxy-6-metoxy-1,4-benzoquinol methylase
VVAINRTLGANLDIYSSAMDETAEQADFDWTRIKRQRVLSVIRGFGKLARAADIGCRGGLEAAFYQREAGIGEMHGFDIAEAPLVAARRRGLLTHVWISGEQDCPVADGTFDLVLALDVIEHLFDTDVFLSELHRIVRKDGHVLIATPNLGWWWSRLRLLAGRAPCGIGATSPLHRWDPVVDTKHLRIGMVSEWRQLFTLHGFRCERVIGYNYPGLLKFPFNIVDTLLVDVKHLWCSSIFVLTRTA